MKEVSDTSHQGGRQPGARIQPTKGKATCHLAHSFWNHQLRLAWPLWSWVSEVDHSLTPSHQASQKISFVGGGSSLLLGPVELPPGGLGVFGGGGFLKRL